MEPKFQSSFIPKSPIASASPTAGAQVGRRVAGRERSLLGTLAFLVFTISVLLAMGVFGYKFYLNYRIDQMGTALEQARATLQPEVIDELTRLNTRIISTKDLVANHRIVLPLFEFLEASTLRTVRFSSFHYSVNSNGIELFLLGEARGYEALALQAEAFDESGYFTNSIFSGLSLNEVGDVMFSFNTTVSPDFLSYEKEIESILVPPAPQIPLTSPSTDTSTVDDI